VRTGASDGAKAPSDRLNRLRGPEGLQHPGPVADETAVLGASFDDVLGAAQAGAEWAWSRLYEDLAGHVLGYLRLRGAAEPEDLLGEVWLQVARNLGGFQGDERDFRAWVFTVAHHRIIDERRYRARRPSEPAETLPDEALVIDDVEEQALRSSWLDDVQALMEQLTDDQRDVLTLRILGGLTIPEIGRVVGKPVGSVKALQRRGLRALVRLSEEQGVPLLDVPSVTRVE
jgi:RNA polymerase sigma-70 factor (ECF subfamily)